MMILVKNNNVTKAFKVLNKKLHGEGIFKDVKDKQAFKSKGQIKREKLKAAKARWNKKKKIIDSES